MATYRYPVYEIVLSMRGGGSRGLSRYLATAKCVQGSRVSRYSLSLIVEDMYYCSR